MKEQGRHHQATKDQHPPLHTNHSRRTENSRTLWQLTRETLSFVAQASRDLFDPLQTTLRSPTFFLMSSASLSYILLASPPCTPTSFRPESDATHWCRRDALSRITTQTLYQGHGTPNTTCDDVTFLFTGRAGVLPEDNEDAHLSPTAMTMSASLVGSVPVPTERNLLTLWKKAAQAANGVNKSRTLVAATDELDVSVKCSHTVAGEAVLHGLGGGGSGGGSSTASVTTTTTSVTGGGGGFDKRLLLRTLQQSCPIDFLREHGLNGSEALILKKRNRACLEAAESKWREVQEEEKRKKQKQKQKQKVDDTTTLSLVAGSEADCQVVDAFKVLFLRASRKSSVGLEKLTVLLLHEDFPHELPVYRGVEAEAEVEAGEEGSSRVIVVMGAVRDMSEGENQSVILAAKQMGVRVVGANLGRVAEFTSKIACVMTMHAMGNVLRRAVDELPVIESHRIEKLESARETNGSETNGSAVEEDSTFNVIHEVGLRSEDVNVEFDRSKLFVLVQLVVCTLYRSHIAREVAGEGEQETGRKKSKTEGVSVVLVFADGSEVVVNQREFMVEMSERHFGAPTEAHILDCLQSVIEKKAGKAGKGDERRRGVEEIVVDVLGDREDREKERRRRVRVIDVVYDGGGEEGEAAAELGKEVYANGDGGQCDVVVLFRPTSCRRPTDQGAIDGAMNQWHGSKKSKRRYFVRARVGGDGVTFPGRAVTALQQWSGMGRLRGGVDGLMQKQRK